MYRAICRDAEFSCLSSRRLLDSYLVIAEEVLRAVRQPLSPREILRHAYSKNLVSPRLFGKTQHKTLQARLSEDILLYKEWSSFFRTEPGKFFLREFIPDNSLPEKHRTPILARRRRRDLPSHRALAFQVEKLMNGSDYDLAFEPDKILNYITSGQYHYAHSTTNREADEVIIWSFVVVLRGDCVLTYRHGRYREERDSFLRRRSIGFFTPVVEDDLTLFDQQDHGILSAGIRAVCIDLDLPRDQVWRRIAESTNIECFMFSNNGHGARDLLAVICLRCPDWFEPLTRRLAINDLRWHDLGMPINHIEDFDPWSRLVLGCAQLSVERACVLDEAAS
jgi:hypothetical protein